MTDHITDTAPDAAAPDDGTVLDGTPEVVVETTEHPELLPQDFAEFGVRLPETTRITVWDSTAELRYMVLPMRPAGTEAFDERRLAGLVTRDAMIGTGLPGVPA